MAATPGGDPAADAAAVPAAAPGLLCSVCTSPVPPPVRGGPSYRRLLACAKLGVCTEHLTPGVHVLESKRVRFCTNHHVLHPAEEFESGSAASRATSQTTCTRARSLSLARIKRQRSGAAQQPGRGEGSAPGFPTAPRGPAAVSQHQLAVSLPLPCDWDEDVDVDEALFGWSFGDNSGGSGGMSVGFSAVDPLDDDPFACLMPPYQHPRLTLQPPRALVLEEEQGGGGQVQLAAPVLHSTLVTAAAAQALQQQQQQQQQQSLAAHVLQHPLVGAATSQLHALATSPNSTALLRCFAGDKARAHVAECPSAVSTYLWVHRIFTATITQRQNRMLANLHERFRACVVQARQELVVFSARCESATELGRVLDAVHAMSTRRGALLTSLARRTSLLAPSIALMVQEVIDGNAMHLCNAGVMRSLVHAAAAAGSGNGDAAAEVVRLVAEFAVVQLGLLRDALAERAAWLDALAGRQGHSKFDIMRGLDGLWQSVHQSWVGIHEAEAGQLQWRSRPP